MSYASTPMIDQVQGTYFDAPIFLQSITHQLAITVSQNIKTEIINASYVDITLLPNNTHVDPTEKTQFMSMKGVSLLSEKLLNLLSKLTHTEKWTDAFLIYASIYCAVNLNSLQGLFKYIHDVRWGASRVGDLGFKSYHEQFRLCHSIDPTIPWGNIDNG